MLKRSIFLIATAAAVLVTASCARERSAAGGSSAPSAYCDQMQTEAARVQCRNDDRPAARTGGRAAGAGGSHAPGSTGLGHGTHPADATAEFRSTR
jgi:hypothetical protein